MIIPARNEELDLAQAASRPSWPPARRRARGDRHQRPFDHDRTGAIADAAALAVRRLKVIHDPELPPGWLGKCNAMEQAARQASGDVLLFTDADIMFKPICFAAALDEMERRELDLLSLFPRMNCVSVWEEYPRPIARRGD